MLDRRKRCHRFATRYVSTQQVGCCIAESAEKHPEPVFRVEERSGRYFMPGLPRNGMLVTLPREGGTYKPQPQLVHRLAGRE